MSTPVEAAVVFLATAFIAALLAGLGSLVRPRDQEVVFDLSAGHGLFGLGALIAVRLGLSLDVAVTALLALGAVGLFTARCRGWLQFGQDTSPLLGIALVVPLAFAAAMIPLTAWDDFSHWLPNARYLLEQRTFPDTGLPPPPSQHGTYPPGTALITYGVARLCHLIGETALPETASPVMTILLFGSLAAAAVSFLDCSRVAPLAATAVTALCVVYANPAFVPRIVFTNYGDTPTAAHLALAVLALVRGFDGAALMAAIPAGFSLAAVANLKQSGIVLVFVALGCLGLVALSSARARRIAAIASLSLAALPPVAIWALWRRHAAHATGGFSVRAFGEWAWALAPQTLASMGRVVLSKIAFFGLAIVAAIYAARTLRQPSGHPASRVALAFALLVPAWASVLFLSYLGTSFSDSEIAAAASFWRYMTQLGGLSGIVLVLFADRLIAAAQARLADGTPPVRGGAARRLGLTLGALVLVLPVFASRFLWPSAREPAPPLRQAASQLAEVVRGDRPVLVVDPHGNGMSEVALRFSWLGVAPTIWSRNVIPASEYSANSLRSAADRLGVEHVMVVSTDPVVLEAFDMSPLPPRSWRLLQRDGERWRLVREGSW